jgi:hypothetical protein
VSRYKTETTTLPILEAIEFFYNDIESLREEIQEIVDNAQGTGLENTARIQTLEESSGYLDFQMEGPEDPVLEFLKTQEPIVIGLTVRGGKKRGQKSRSVRASNAICYARAAVDAIHEIIEKERAELEAPVENEEDALESALALVKTMRTERAILLDELENYAQEIENHIGEAESAEFPGMFG